MNQQQLAEIKAQILENYDPTTDEIINADFYYDNPTAAINDIKWLSKTVLELLENNVTQVNDFD